MRSYQIELPAEIGQGSPSFDPADHPRNIEERSRGAEKRLSIGIEAENVVAEKFANVKKVAGAAAKIEKAQWRRAIEPKILGALDVDLDPINNILETIDLGRAGAIWILMAQIFKLKPIDVVQNPTFVDGMDGATEMFERAGERVGRK